MRLYDCNGYTYISNRKTKKSNHKKTRIKAFAIIASVFFIFIFVVLNTVGAERNRTVRFYGKSYFGVQVGGYTTIEAAKNISEIIIGLGGCGAVITDKSYRVLAMIYVNEQDAESVSRKLCLNGMNARVYEISLEERKTNAVLTLADKNKVESTISELFGVLDELLEVSVSYDKGEESKSRVADIFKDKAKLLTDRALTLSENQGQPVRMLSKLLSGTAAFISEAAQDITGGNIKCALTECVLLIKEFYDSFEKE